MSWVLVRRTGHCAEVLPWCHVAFSKTGDAKAILALQHLAALICVSIPKDITTSLWNNDCKRKCLLNLKGNQSLTGAVQEEQRQPGGSTLLCCSSWVQKPSFKINTEIKPKLFFLKATSHSTVPPL